PIPEAGGRAGSGDAACPAGRHSSAVMMAVPTRLEASVARSPPLWPGAVAASYTRSLPSLIRSKSRATPSAKPVIVSTGCTSMFTVDVRGRVMALPAASAISLVRLSSPSLAIDSTSFTRMGSMRRPLAAWAGGPGHAPGPPTPPLVAGGQRNGDAFLLQHFAHVLEPLVLADGDRAAIALTLLLARRVLHVGLHEGLDGIADGDQGPGALGVVVHEEVVALLWILPEIEHLRHGGHVLLRALPAQVRVHSEGARGLAVVAAEVE